MDIQTLNHRNNPKYSSFVYRLLLKNTARISACGMPRLVKLKGKSRWYIGWFEPGAWFTGRGIDLFNDRTKVCLYSYTRVSEEDIEEEKSWMEYARIGKCAFSRYAHQWVQVNKSSRRCRYCGKWQRRRVKTVKTIERRVLWVDEHGGRLK